jgi:hypothetical protein
MSNDLFGQTLPSKSFGLLLLLLEVLALVASIHLPSHLLLLGNRIAKSLLLSITSSQRMLLFLLKRKR